MNRTLNAGLKTFALVLGSVAFGSQVFASNVTLNGDGTETLTFGGQVNATNVNTFFNGGSDAFGTAGGAANNVGVTFSTPAEFLNAGFNGSGFAGGTGRFENAPLGATGVLFMGATPTTTAPILDDASGFSSIALNYSLLNNTSSFASSVQLWSGLDGTGSLLGTLALSAAGTTVACTSSNDEFCTWSNGSLALAGVAESAVFTGNARTFTEFSQVTLTAPAPVPLPAALWLLVSGAGGFAGFVRRRLAA